MDEFTADAFVNRDDPISVMSFDGKDDLSDVGDDTPAEGRKRDRLKTQAKSIKDHIRKPSAGKADTGFSMQDRLLEKYGCELQLPWGDLD